MAMETSVRSALLAAALCLLCLRSSASYAPFGKPLRLSSVPSLTFSAGRYATYRRSSPIRQLVCEKGCHLHDPDEVRCTNVLLKDNEVFWECEADLPSDVSLKDTEVNCEGYDSKEDENVLEGSCGLKYSLVRKGSERRSGYQYWLLLMTIILVPLHLYTIWYRRT